MWCKWKQCKSTSTSAEPVCGITVESLTSSWGELTLHENACGCVFRGLIVLSALSWNSTESRSRKITGLWTESTRKYLKREKAQQKGSRARPVKIQWQRTLADLAKVYCKDHATQQSSLNRFIGRRRVGRGCLWARVEGEIGQEETALAFYKSSACT